MDLAGPDFSGTQYWTEWDERGERLIMPLRRGWGVVWSALGLFAIGAVQHAIQLFDEPEGLDYAVIALFLIGALQMVINLLTSVLAREVLRIEGSDLVHGWRMLWLKRERRYPVKEISALSAEREITPREKNQVLSPFRDFGRIGAINFDFRGETYGIGAGLDQVHSQQVVDWLMRRLPRSAAQL